MARNAQKLAAWRHARVVTLVERRRGSRRRDVRRVAPLTIATLLAMLLAGYAATAHTSTTRQATSTLTLTPMSTPTTPLADGTLRSTPIATVDRTAPASPKHPGPLIVLDPGHSPSVHAIDPRTGLDVSDYENEPEMHDVFVVAQIVRDRLRKDGYRVLLTKSRVDSRVTLAGRAAIANNAHAALAVSIHDQAGASGGIAFPAGNNVVYTQWVGGYRVTPAGTRVVFTDKKVAALSARYGRTFQRQRSRVQGASVRLQDSIGYDMSSRGLPAGDMWMVQLLAHVPWIYNEAGGNSAGRIGLSRSGERTYAQGLVAAIEKCVPIRR
jgi:N-acetylmuramoyl-L-alanine amidase